MTHYTDLNDFLTSDIFDTRDFIEWLESAREDEDSADDIEDAEAFAEELENSAPDYIYGEAVIADSYFEDYAQELAEDIGAIDRDAPWPTRCIDWAQAARELRMDYTPVECRGITFWVR